MLMSERLLFGSASVVWTEAADGHRAPDVDPMVGRVDLRQVHRAGVFVADGPIESQVEADAAVTDRSDLALVIATADCAPIAIASATANGPVGAVHAGWKGLEAGVVDAAVDALRDLGASEILAAVGPCIQVGCYAFGPDDLDRLAGHWGARVRGRTALGAPGLDLKAAVAIALDRAGVELVHASDACTACSGRHFSYRRSGTADRQIMLVQRRGSR